MKLKTVRRSIIGTLLLAVGIIFMGLALLMVYRILFVISENFVYAIGVLGLFFGGALICFEKGRNLIRERKFEISKTEEQMKAPIDELKNKLHVLPAFLGIFARIFLLCFGTGTLVMGLTSFIVIPFFQQTLLSAFAGFTCLFSGFFALRATWCFGKGKTKQVCICTPLSILLFFLFLYLFIYHEL